MRGGRKRWSKGPPLTPTLSPLKSGERESLHRFDQTGGCSSAPALPIIGATQCRSREDERDVRQGLQRSRRVGEPGLHRQREVPGDVQALGRGPQSVLGRDRQAHRLDQALHQGQEHLLCARQRLHQVVRGRHAQRLRQLRRPASEDPRRPGRHHLGRRRPDDGREDHLPPAARARVQVRQRAQGQWRQEGRPRHHLPADDPGGGLRHARLRPHRRGALRGVRRLLARQPRRPHRRCRLQIHRHGGRGRARRPADPAQEEHRRGAEEVQGRREGAGGAPHRRTRSRGAPAGTSGCTRSW